MKFLFGCMVGLWLGICLCAVWLHTRMLPQQYNAERALYQCAHEKRVVQREMRRVNLWLSGVGK